MAKRRNRRIPKYKKPFIVFSTGISGCLEKAYLEKFVQYCRTRGKKVKVYNVWDIMREKAGEISIRVNLDHIMKSDHYFQKALRLAAFEQIEEEIRENRKYDVVIINGHAFFYWKKGFMPAYDKSRKMFEPDIYITFIEDYRNILATLNARVQWQDQDLTEGEVLHWQDVEVGVTRGWAEEEDKPFFCVPSSRSQSPSLLYKLVFHPEIEALYPAMPISHLQDPKDRKRIDRIIRELDKRFAVFSPLSVEVVGSVRVRRNKELARSVQSVHSHIVYRDEEWLLSQCKIMVVIWPKREPPEALKKNRKLAELWPSSVASPGANHETHTGFRRTRDVWTIFLGDETSPFVAYYNTKLFKSEREFLQFLDKRNPERKNFTW